MVLWHGEVPIRSWTIGPCLRWRTQCESLLLSFLPSVFSQLLYPHACNNKSPTMFSTEGHFRSWKTILPLRSTSNGRFGFTRKAFASRVTLPVCRIHVGERLREGDLKASWSKSNPLRTS